MQSKAVFIAATGQNVGKTTTCLGLVSGLMKRHGAIGYMKPIGQEHVETETKTHVDKDVVLFRSHFQLTDPYEQMSPVLFPRGFTRDFLDGKVSREELLKKIQAAGNAIAKRHPITIVEGTGHIGVGSIVDLNNAQIASLLKTPVVLIASGGLGSSFDELELNRTQCEKYGAKVAGIILNRVLPEKRDMILEYMGKALQRWKIPLLGAIPYDSFLSLPSMGDFELLFHTKLLSGGSHQWRHLEEIRLVANNAELPHLNQPNLLIIVPASREDLIASMLFHFEHQKSNSALKEPLSCGIIFTGRQKPAEAILAQLQNLEIPSLYVPVPSLAALKMINSHTHKIRREDTAKIAEAIRVVETHIDFDLLESLKA